MTINFIIDEGLELQDLEIPAEYEVLTRDGSRYLLKFKDSDSGTPSFFWNLQFRNMVNVLSIKEEKMD